MLIPKQQVLLTAMIILTDEAWLGNKTKLLRNNNLPRVICHVSSPKTLATMVPLWIFLLLHFESTPECVQCTAICSGIQKSANGACSWNTNLNVFQQSEHEKN